MSTAWVCGYCNTPNLAGSKTCQACGAPLSAPPIPLEARPTQQSRPISTPPVDPHTLDQARESGEKLEQAVQQGMYWYSVLWRTLAEAFSIAVSAAILGAIGAGTSRWWLGVVAGGLLGAVVGASNKPYWLAALSAPTGVIVGALAWLPIWFFTGRSGGMLFTAGAAGILLAFLGSRRRLNNLWENLRPFLGASGGLLFSGLGALLVRLALALFR